MLKWRRVSAGGSWEISLTMQWLRRTHTHMHARFITCWGLVSLAVPVQSHHLNSFKCGLIEANFVTSKAPAMNGGSTRAWIPVGPLWKDWCRLHMLPINMLQVMMTTLHLWQTYGWSRIFECLLLFNLRCSGRGHGCSRMFVTTAPFMQRACTQHGSMALYMHAGLWHVVCCGTVCCSSHSRSTINNYIYEIWYEILFFLAWNLADWLINRYLTVHM